MEEIEQSGGGKTAAQRAVQACQRCRSLKTRCYLSEEQPGTCQRCLKTKRECVWAEAPRKVRKHRGPSRISQVEQKIDGLVASLVNSESNKAYVTNAPVEPAAERAPRPNPTSSSRPLAPGSWLPFPSSFTQEETVDYEPSAEPNEGDVDTNQQFLTKLREIHSFGDDPNSTRPPDTLFHSTNKSEPPIDHATVRQLLTSGEADVLLSDFCSMSASFPFVPLSPMLSAHDLHAAKPMLFLAIITVSSWRDHNRQMLLDEIYRNELANRTLVRPRRTLPLLQGIIVYLSWYHFVFSHKTQQIFFLQQVAIGLALDLGLHQKTKRTLIDFPGIPKPSPLLPEDQRERQRTLLGCYYLSSMIAGGLQKPNLLKFNDYMAECARDLKLTCEYAGDKVISELISLRRLDDQIHDTFYYGEEVDLPIGDPRISMNLRFMVNQLEEWKRSSHSEEYQRTLDLSSSFTELQLHSVALRPATSSNGAGNASNTQLNSLLSTLEAAKSFLDSLLSFPVTQYHWISFSEWMRLPTVVMTTARLCIPSEAHSALQWDVKGAQDRVRLDLYLESLCYRMQELSTYDRKNQSHPDFWWAMRMIMDLTRKWYCRKINPKNASQPTPTNIPTPDTTNGSSNNEAESSILFLNHSFEVNDDFTQHGMGDMGLDMDMGMGMLNSGSIRPSNPFAAMQSPDFDMDQILDLGIWGPESYEGMGFGGNSTGL
ncbi:hypothetical protein BS50DRAFT_565856 [Corynespora cassiicola Philippines]|uniref:Zn(2)-C6 fungal-type domain-containing protein n=1 Tax=Corynespora cassiicola Philippines TaxID=1448308 RepID=A0A2T2N1I3_CORCC|nr:hypothetical protein BS50DRAFT_565856 [Corynespora cassiicola Philippines]